RMLVSKIQFERAVSDTGDLFGQACDRSSDLIQIVFRADRVSDLRNKLLKGSTEPVGTLKRNRRRLHFACRHVVHQRDQISELLAVSVKGLKQLICLDRARGPRKGSRRAPLERAGEQGDLFDRPQQVRREPPSERKRNEGKEKECHEGR